MTNNMNRFLQALGGYALAWSLIAAPVSAEEDKAKTKAKAAVSGERGIIGEWWSEEKDGRIRFFKAKDGTFQGILAWSKNPRADTENDNPEMRSRQIVGIVLMWKLRYKDGAYEDGFVYNPEDGNVYRVDVKVLGPDKLEVRGYMGISLLGQSQEWTRYR